jgi:glycosyltransferase involved in cell wall biosynthesis
MSIADRRNELETGIETPVTPSSPVLAIFSASGAHALRSGYSLLADYLPNVRVLTAKRSAPQGLARLWRFGISRRAVTSWYQIGSASVELRAWREIRKGFQGIVHFLWADSDFGCLDLLARSKNYALCGTFHQPPSMLRKIIRFPNRLRNFDAVILMTETQRPYFLESGVPADAIHVIHHGVDTTFFHPIEQPAHASFTILSVGSYLRNFGLLRDVCKRMESTSGVRFRIVAPEHVRPLFAENANVEFLSKISDDQLLTEYRNASCFLFTAEEATANNSLLEALACGLPVVAVDVGGVREYVSPLCAEIVKHGDVSGITEALLGLRTSHRMKPMAGAARRRAETLDWKLVAQRTSTVYTALSQRIAGTRIY